MKRYVYILLTLILLFPYSVLAHTDVDVYQLTSIVPADSSSLIGFNKDDVITFTTNADSIFGGFNVVIWDSNTNNIIYEDFTVDKNSEDEWELTIYENLFFLKGHTYQVELTGHEGKSPKSEVVAKFSAIYFGNSTSTGEEDDTDYEYSNVRYDYWSPREGSMITDKRITLMVVFTGEVTIDEDRCAIFDEDGVEHTFERISHFNDEILKWEFHIPSDFYDNCISHFKVCIYAKDKGGRVVKGNAEKGRNSHLELTFNCELGYPKLNVTPADGIMRSLQKLTFSYDNGISFLNEEKQINLFKEDKKTIVQTINSTDLEESSDMSSLSYLFNDTLQAEGIYYLYVPDSTFALRKKNRMLPNREKWVKYEIVDRLGLYGVTITPEDGSVVPSLSKIYITFYRWDFVEPYRRNRDTITVTNETGNIVSIAKADYDKNRINSNQCFIQLETPITQTGHYFLNVPAYSFILGSDGKHLSDSMYFEFDVEEPPFVVPKFDVTTELDENLALRHILVDFLDYELVRVASNSIDAILTDSLGNEVAKGKIYIGRFRYQLCITLYDEYILQRENDYVLTIPANSITLNGETYKADLEVPFHFDPSTSGIYHLDMASADDHVRVYNLQGMLIREGNSKEVLEGLKGLYIINGRKILIK